MLLIVMLGLIQKGDDVLCNKIREAMSFARVDISSECGKDCPGWWWIERGGDLKPRQGGNLRDNLTQYITRGLE